MAHDRTDDRLRERLGTLLAAVPAQPDATTDGRTPAELAVRPRVVARPSLGLTGVTIAVVAIVLGALAFSQRPSTGGPITAIATDGPFRVTLTIPKASYVAGQPITGITASLEYTRPGSVQINHSAGGPLGFEVSSGDGAHRTEPIWDFACASSELVNGAPVSKPYVKSGGFFPEHSDYPWLSSFFASQPLVLEPGRWTITAIAEFLEAGCGGRATVIRASATISVGSALATTAASSADAGPASLPPDVGSADWWVDPAFGPVQRDATEIHGLLQERACASGRSPDGRIIGPEIEYRSDAVVVTYHVRMTGGTCPSNPTFPVTIELAEPVGGRALIDGGSGRDALLDPNVIQQPTEDCGPLQGTNDTKIACMALVQATIGDQFARFTTVSVRPSGPPCSPGDCLTAAAIEARAWQVDAVDRLGSTFAWLCDYRAETATCNAQASPTGVAVPGDPALLAGDPRLTQCGIPTDRTWMAFLMARASDFSQHFPGWSQGADELLVSDPALVVISTGQPFGGGGPSSSQGAQELVYELCIAVGAAPDAIAHHYGPTRFDAVVPVLGGPSIPMP